MFVPLMYVFMFSIHHHVYTLGHAAGISKKVIKLKPIAVIKG